MCDPRHIIEMSKYRNHELNITVLSWLWIHENGSNYAVEICHNTYTSQLYHRDKKNFEEKSVQFLSKAVF